MAWPLIIAGAAIFAGGLTGGAATKSGGGGMNFAYPEATPEEKEMAKMQLSMAKELKGKIDDPKLLRDLYKNLPKQNMDSEDISRFASDFDEIDNQIAQIALDQSKMALGKNLSDWVQSGQMTEKQAEDIEITSRAKLDAMRNILIDKGEASRIKFEREVFLGSQKQGLNVAGLINDIDTRNKSLFNNVVKTGLDYATTRAKNVMGLQINQQQAENQANIANYQTKNAFLQSALQMGAQTAVSGYNSYQNNQYMNQQMEAGNLSASDVAFIKAIKSS